MSVRVMAWVFKDAPTTNPVDQLVLLAIADNCQDDGSGAYPSVPTLARKTRLTERTVMRVVKRLRAHNLLLVQPGAGTRGTNLYSVRVATPSEKVTPDTVSPLTGSHPGPKVTPTPDAVSGGECHRVTPTPDRKSPKPSKPSSTSSTTILSFSDQELQDAWNKTVTPDIGKCRELTVSRRSKIKARRKEQPSLDTWREIFARIEASAFCHGQSGRGDWRASFDWIIQNADNALKVLEGKYDNNAAKGSRPGRIVAPAGKYDGIAEHDDPVDVRAAS